MRKAMVVGIAVAAVIAVLKNAFDALTLLVLPCTILLLLIWGTSRLIGLLGGSKWSENIRVALALAVVVGFFLFCGFMLSTPEHRVFHHADLNAEIQEVRIEKNKVSVGMTIIDVLPLVHGTEIFATADGVWLSVLPDNKRFYYSPDPINVWQHDDGTFTLSCHCGSAQVSPNSHVTESQAAALMVQQAQAGQDLQNLTEPQAAALLKQKMSDGFDWSWEYKTFKHSRQYVFTVTFDHDGRVNYISDVHYTDLQYHRPS